MNKFTVAAKRFGSFMKRNAVYFLIVLCIASVATVIALAVTRDNGNDTNIGGPDTPVINPGGDDNNDPEPEEQTFIAPTNGTVAREFSDSELVWNPTLEQMEAHLGIDYTGTDTNVFASEKGTVKEVGSDELNGNYVILSHENGYETAYYSLAKPSELKKGDSVEKGQKLGDMSNTQGVESLDEPHLHFEMMKDGKHINPLDVLILEEK